MESQQVRGKPLSAEETKSLLNLVENSRIINNKSTNAINNRLKIAEWKRITDEFNATIAASRRTPQQLRLKWENLKKNARRRSCLIRMNDNQNGDKTPEYISQDTILDRVSSLLGNTTVQAPPEILVMELGDGPQEISDENCNTSRTSDEKELHQHNEDTQITETQHSWQGARNRAIAEYYTKKKEYLDAKIDHIWLQNKKLKLEIENLKKGKLT